MNIPDDEHRASLICWAISDGAAGNERQALALAHAMGLQPHTIHLSLKQPWDALAPHLTAGADAAMVSANGQRISAPWPDLAIGCGRRAALLTRCLRQWSGGRCFSVQILDPRVDSRHFDIVIAPRHDHVAGANVLRSVGALNPVNPAWLAQGRQAWPDLARFAAPRTAVLIGASTRAQRLDQGYFDALLTQLKAFGGSFLVSASRRTPLPQREWLRRQFALLPGCFWASEDDGNNPYAGFLGWADRIVVTPDSVNMLSEACASGKPVHSFVQQPLRGKLAEFHAILRDAGLLFDLSATPADAAVTPLTETADLAAEVEARWTRARNS